MKVPEDTYQPDEPRQTFQAQGKRTAMNEFPSFLSVASGFLMRIALPLGATFLIAWAIRKLDEHWQSEGSYGNEDEFPKCWEYMKCSPEAREQCPLHNSSGVICWEQVSFNGVLQPRCESCAYRRTFVAVSELLT